MGARFLVILSRLLKAPLYKNGVNGVSLTKTEHMDKRELLAGRGDAVRFDFIRTCYMHGHKDEVPGLWWRGLLTSLH